MTFSTTFSTETCAELLCRTPQTLDAWLRSAPKEWTECKADVESWSPRQILGHLIHGEKTDWIPRARIILSESNANEFEPFDRFAMLTDSAHDSFDSLLDDFARLRAANVETLRGFNIGAQELALTGVHPEFGSVTLAQLLSAWVAHDLSHISQIARVIANEFKSEVGPWTAYLGVYRK